MSTASHWTRGTGYPWRLETAILVSFVISINQHYQLSPGPEPNSNDLSPDD